MYKFDLLHIPVILLSTEDQLKRCSGEDAHTFVATQIADDSQLKRNLTITKDTIHPSTTILNIKIKDSNVTCVYYSSYNTYMYYYTIIIIYI